MSRKRTAFMTFAARRMEDRALDEPDPDEAARKRRIAAVYRQLAQERLQQEREDDASRE